VENLIDMKNIQWLIFLFPIFLQAQEYNTPFVKFDQDVILFYLPSESISPLLLPASKPGFVHILRTPGIQTQTNQEISDDLVSGISELCGDPATAGLHLISEHMTTAQKTNFLEQYACLILLNYTNVGTLDTLFYTQAVSLKKETNQAIRENASLVVKMVDLYRKE